MTTPFALGKQKTKPFVQFSPIYLAGTRAVRVLLGDGSAVPTATGGWAAVGRAKQKGITVWEGYDPYAMTIPVMFDGFATNTSQEEKYETLRRIMRVPAGPANQPSPVRVYGPVPLTRLLWVIQNIALDEGSVIRRETDGHMIRVAATVSLLEYVEPDVVIAARPSPAKAAAARAAETEAAPPSARTYTVKRGDTLSRIAQTHLGSYKRYLEIARLNDIRDPNRIFPGQVLRLP
jgi:hypothetical protein